jgi:hypothetical protein
MDAITSTSGTEEPDERDERGRREAIAAAARRAASHLVKTRARRYARTPSALDALHPGLSRTTPATLVAIAAHLVEREIRSPRRWFGFGGEVSLLNARAALLLGRARRRRAPGSDDR